MNSDVPRRPLITASKAVDLAVNDLTNAEWNRAEPVPIEHYWSGDRAPLNRRAEARILWSDKALHVRFVCHQGEPLVVSDHPQTEKKTMGLWNRDVCEIFIAPDENVIERYFEFEAAPTGEWLDVAIHWSPKGRESDWQFHSGMSCAAMKTITKGGTSNDLELVWIGMRIPWNHWIHQPQKGERWRVNLFRCVGKDPNRGYLAWQPTKTPQPGFHVPQVFGWLRFG